MIESLLDVAISVGGTCFIDWFSAHPLDVAHVASSGNEKSFL